MATTEQLLNLDGISQRQSWWRWDMLDESLVRVGTFGQGGLPKVDGTGASIQHSTGNAIMRTVSGFTLTPDDGEAFDPVGVFVQPWLVLENGAAEPLGVFMFVDEGRDRTPLGVGFDGALMDQTILVDVDTEMAYGVGQGSLISATIESILEDHGVLLHNVVATGRIAGDDIGWPPFTSWLQIVNELAALAGCLPLFFDGAGVAQVVPAPDVAGDTPTVTFVDGRNIFATTIRESSNRLTAPNRFIVVDSGATASDIRGVYDLPASALNSYANIGRVIPHGVTEQGLQDVVAAEDRARLLAIQEGTVLERIGFDGPPDWRHGAYDVIDFRGARYLEESWTLPCEVGASMAHVLVRIVS